MTFAKHAGMMVVAALGLTLLATSSQADDSRKGGRSGKGADHGFEGQIEVPAPFAHGTAFLLMGEDDCGFEAPWLWMSMAKNTRNRDEEAGGLDTPGFPIACARNGQSVTCKIFRDGFTYAFAASVKTDTPSQLGFGTPGGFIDVAVDLQKKTATFKQSNPRGEGRSCAATYKTREEAAADVAKLDPAPASLPARDRPNGMASSGDRLTCHSRHDSSSGKDPLTGRRTTVCSACTDKCWFVGEECKAGVCVYTGKGDTRGSYGSSSSGAGSTARSETKKAKKALGESCKFNDDCASKKCGTISSGSLHKCVSR